jgi:hypothetical protein
MAITRSQLKNEQVKVAKAINQSLLPSEKPVSTNSNAVVNLATTSLLNKAITKSKKSPRINKLLKKNKSKKYKSRVIPKNTSRGMIRKYAASPSTLSYSKLLNLDYLDQPKKFGTGFFETAVQTSRLTPNVINRIKASQNSQKESWPRQVTFFGSKAIRYVDENGIKRVAHVKNPNPRVVVFRRPSGKKASKNKYFSRSVRRLRVLNQYRRNIKSMPKRQAFALAKEQVRAREEKTPQRRAAYAAKYANKVRPERKRSGKPRSVAKQQYLDDYDTTLGALARSQRRAQRRSIVYNPKLISGSISRNMKKYGIKRKSKPQKPMNLDLLNQTIDSVING